MKPLTALALGTVLGLVRATASPAVTWRIDAEGRPPQTRPSEAAALELQAELMAKGGVRYVVVWWMGPPGLRKGPRTARNAPLSDCEGARVPVATRHPSRRSGANTRADA